MRGCDIDVMSIKSGLLLRTKQRGFTLLELLIATVVFLIIAGAALSLFQTEQPLLNRQQNYSALNIAMRNSVAQMQLDVVNAGANYYPSTNVPGWPVGATIVNQNPSTACNNTTTFVYSSTCFDTLNIITMDPNTPPGNLENGAFTLSCATDTISTTSSPIYVSPPSGTTAATLASDYHNGDQLILLNSTNSKLTTIMLSGLTGTGGTATTYTSGTHSAVKLTFNTTNANGTNTSANDPPGITTTANTELGTSFCSTDWIMRLAPTITYQVDTTTASNPKLTRTVSGTESVLAEQVIGFKVGAITWNTSDDTSMYSFNASAASASPMTPTAGYTNQWWLIRSIQIVLIGRTSPNPGSTFTYRNGFDGGPYQIESEIATINPRNMTMNND
jgi:prepilin-type N-terminal cleavage/methylation domain-containing protein